MFTCLSIDVYFFHFLKIFQNHYHLWFLLFWLENNQKKNSLSLWSCNTIFAWMNTIFKKKNADIILIIMMMMIEMIISIILIIIMMSFQVLFSVKSKRKTKKKWLSRVFDGRKSYWLIEEEEENCYFFGWWYHLYVNFFCLLVFFLLIFQCFQSMIFKGENKSNEW